MNFPPEKQSEKPLTPAEVGLIGALRKIKTSDPETADVIPVAINSILEARTRGFQLAPLQETAINERARKLLLGYQELNPHLTLSPVQADYDEMISESVDIDDQKQTIKWYKKRGLQVSKITLQFILNLWEDGQIIIPEKGHAHRIIRPNRVILVRDLQGNEMLLYASVDDKEGEQSVTISLPKKVEPSPEAPQEKQGCLWFLPTSIRQSIRAAFED